MTHRKWVLACVLGVAACNETDIEEMPLETGDEFRYAVDVANYVGYRCASLDCHGDMGRTLRLYAYRGLRLQAVLRNQSLSSFEIADNVLSLSAFDTLGGPIEDNEVLLKGLAVDAGGMAHVGGAVWESTEDPGYRCIAAWLEGKSDEMAAQEACAIAAERVRPDERD